MTPEDEGLLEGEDYNDGDLNDGSDGVTTSEPKDITDEQVIAYLKAKELPFESLDQIQNQHKSVSGMTAKINELGSQLKSLQKIPGFAEFITKAKTGVAPEGGKDLPDVLKNRPTDEIQKLESMFEHFTSPKMQKLKEEIQLMITEAVFNSKHEGYKDNETEFVEFMKRRGIYADTPENLSWAYELFLKEKEPGDGGTVDNTGNDPPQPTTTNIRRTGVSPSIKPGARTKPEMTYKPGGDNTAYWKSKEPK